MVTSPDSQSVAACTAIEIVSIIESTDWSATPVGPRSDWPQSLNTALSIMINSGFPMVVMWGEGLVLFYNAGYAPVLGDKHPWAMGRPMREVWPEIWDTIGPMLHGVLQTGVATYDEDLLLPLFRSGYLEECYFTFSYSPIADRGNIAGVFCAVAETSRKVIGERRLRMLHELEAQAFAEKDVDQACLTAVNVLRRDTRDVPFSRIYLFDKNDRLRLIDGSGPSPRDDEDWPIQEVTLANEPRIVQATIDATTTLTSAERVTRAMVLPIAGAGQSRAMGAIVLGVSPFCGLDAEYRRFLELVAGQIATAINSARTYAETQSRVEALAELDRAKTTFFSNISHEFRTPLTLMLGPLERVLHDGSTRLAEDDRGELLTARRNAYRLLKLVNHLLEFSRLESNRSDASYELTDLAAYTTEIASGFRSTIEGAGLQLEVDAPVHVFAYIDRGMFERIVLNLMSNAIKYTFRGRIGVSVWGDDAHAYVRVADTGSGIPEEELPRLFERFRRVRGATGRVEEGTGIGLALVDELVRLHGGTIGVQSRLGEGSSFTVCMPLGKAHLPSEHIVASTSPTALAPIRLTQYLQEIEGWMGEPQTTDREAPTGAETIMIVDDNADLRAYLGRILSARWRVAFAHDGAVALQRIKADPPDLVLSDVMMPHCDGIELLRRLRENPATQRIPIILLSARAGEEASIEGLREGADDYIIKPFTEERLFAKIEAALTVARIREDATRKAQAARDQAVESERFLQTLADAIPLMVGTSSPEGKPEYFNKRWFEYTGLTREESFTPDGWLSVVHPDDVPSVVETWKRLSPAGTPHEVELRIRDRDGNYRWFLVQSAPSRNSEGQIVRWLSTASDIEEQKQLAERQHFLDEASNVLSSTLDVTALLQKITELCVPRFADWCQVQVVSADDRLIVEAVHHQDPKRAEALQRLVGRQVVTQEAAFGSPDALRTGQIRELDHNETLRAVRENVRNYADRQAYAQAGLGNALIVPLVARDEALGTLHLVNVNPDTKRSRSTVAIAEELARRAALAIDNSRLYEREHRVATALQQAMLPKHLPHIERVEFSSAYRPAEREAQVGGDWYDAFRIAPDRVAVSIGDVAGHGLGAAVAMSEARQALRLGALEGLPPAEILRRANVTLSLLNDSQPIITAILGIIDVSNATFTYSCAGHPPPAIAPLAGEPRYLEGGGIPIGVLRDAAFPTREVTLEPYSTLLLYTDGLIEFSRNIAQESTRLLEALKTHVPDVLADGADAILRFMLNRRQLDDIAILLATFLPKAAEQVSLTVPAVPQSAVVARRLASRYARVAGLSDERSFNLALAVGEAIANAVEHAYDGGEGDVTLSLLENDGVILGEVADRGRWREGPPMEDRGRGFSILQTITQRMVVHRGKEGTRVTFAV